MDEIEINEDESFPEAQLDKFESDPVFYKKFVKSVEEVVNGNFPLVSLTTRLLCTPCLFS